MKYYIITAENSFDVFVITGDAWYCWFNSNNGIQILDYYYCMMMMVIFDPSGNYSTKLNLLKKHRFFTSSIIIQSAITSKFYDLITVVLGLQPWKSNLTLNLDLTTVWRSLSSAVWPIYTNILLILYLFTYRLRAKQRSFFNILLLFYTVPVDT